MALFARHHTEPAVFLSASNGLWIQYFHVNHLLFAENASARQEAQVLVAALHEYKRMNPFDEIHRMIQRDLIAFIESDDQLVRSSRYQLLIENKMLLLLRGETLQVDAHVPEFNEVPPLRIASPVMCKCGSAVVLNALPAPLTWNCFRCGIALPSSR